MSFETVGKIWRENKIMKEILKIKKDLKAKKKSDERKNIK